MLAKLVTLNPNSSSSIDITKPRFTIGRDQRNDKVFSNIRVSSNHLVIEYKDSQFTLTDISSNGTYINEKKIGKGNTVTIMNGDKIHLLPILKVQEFEVIGFEFIVCTNNEQFEQQVSKKEIEQIDRQNSDENREVKKEQLLDTKIVENEVQSKIINEPPKKKEQSPFPIPKLDGLEDELQCTICNDYLFEAVAANPCNHHFCGSCLCNWFKKQTYECPNCRQKLTGVMMARTINNLVEKWLKANPHEKRSEQLLNKMKEENLIYKNPQEYININTKLTQNKLDKQNLVIQNIQQDQEEHSYDDEYSDNHHSSDDDEDDEYLSNDENFDENKQNQQAIIQQQLVPQQFQNFNNNLQGFNFHHPFGYNNYYQPLGQNLFQQQFQQQFIQPGKFCKSCNGQTWKNFQCPQNQHHVGCGSCARLMPKLEPNEDDNEILQMQCCICKAYHCQFYYGDCVNAALQKFMLVKNLQHQMVVPYNYINVIEYGRLLQHLQRRPQTVIFNFMMENYISKGYFYFQQNKSTFLNPIQEINVKISPNTPICWLCHRKLINFIVFRYVQCIKYDEPLFMQEECHYGINCRQQQNLAHAQKYNHFCEQTKFD